MYWMLFLLPKNYLSFFVGKLAGFTLPRRISMFLLCWYCRHFNVNVKEAEYELSKYNSLQAFFIRKLRPGLRPIEEGLVSPVDGRIVECGQIDNGKLIQVKGREYLISDLLCDEELASRFIDGYFITIYLAPGDYHHIHSPITGKITRGIYIPGKLWPVNDWSVRNIPNLFIQNERIISLEEGENGAVAIVKVGATNVGSITVDYDNFVSNARPAFGRGSCQIAKFDYPSPKSFERGEHLATFNLGSTVVLLIEKNAFRPGSRCQKGAVHMGQSLGVFGLSAGAE